MNLPVVLLHSSASSARQWQGLAESLRAHHEVHAIDFFGHGARGPWPGAAPMRLADEAAPIEALLEGLGGAHLIGHSYGGAVALKLACRRPSLVRSVAVYEPVLFGLLRADAASRRELQGVVTVADAMRASMARGDAEDAARRFITLWSGEATWNALPDDRRQAFATRMPAVLQHFEALFCDAMTAEDLARLRMPLMLLEGAATVASAQRVVDSVHAVQPRARRVRLAGMGHMGPITHAQAVNRHLFDFLSAQTPKSRTCFLVQPQLQTERA